MNLPACTAPLDWDTLLAYWLGELEPDNEARMEEHYIGCHTCSRQLAELVALSSAVRALTRRGGVEFVIEEPFLRRLTADDMKVREYRVPADGSVNCTVTSDDDLVVACLEAQLEGLNRVDLVYLDSAGETLMRRQDVPFSPESTGVFFATRIDALRALPATTIQVRLLAVDQGGERRLGDYTFRHTPPGS